MKNSIFTISLVIGLVGCTSIKNGEYLGGLVHVSGANENKNSNDLPEKKSSEAVANAPDLSAKKNARGICYIGCKSNEPSPMTKLEFSVKGVDVDTAYARIKRDFGFKTRAERISKSPNIEDWLDHSFDFRYQATPSVNYLMRGYKEHKYQNEESPNTIQVELFKDGSKQVYFQVSYYSGNTKDLIGYQNSIKKRIIEAVKG